MPGHDVLAHLGGVAGEIGDIVDLDDVTTTSTTLDFGGKGIARVENTVNSGIVILPNAGFCVLIRHTGTGSAQVNDSDGNDVCEIDNNQTGLCFRVGEATNNRWHSALLTMGTS